jgi:hypothetical protein
MPVDLDAAWFVSTSVVAFICISAALSLVLYFFSVFRDWKLADENAQGYMWTRALLVLDVFILTRIYFEDSLNAVLGTLASFLAMALSILATRHVIWIARAAALYLVFYAFSFIPNSAGHIIGALVFTGMCVLAWHRYPDHTDSIALQLSISVLTTFNFVLLFRFFLEGRKGTSLWTHSVEHLVQGWNCIHQWECQIDAILIASGTAARLLILMGMWWVRRQTKGAPQLDDEANELLQDARQRDLARLDEAILRRDRTAVLEIAGRLATTTTHAQRLEDMRVQRDAAAAEESTVFEIGDAEEEEESKQETPVQQS